MKETDTPPLLPVVNLPDTATAPYMNMLNYAYVKYQCPPPLIPTNAYSSLSDFTRAVDVTTDGGNELATVSTIKNPLTLILVVL